MILGIGLVVIAGIAAWSVAYHWITTRKTPPCLLIAALFWTMAATIPLDMVYYARWMESHRMASVLLAGQNALHNFEAEYPGGAILTPKVKWAENTWVVDYTQEGQPRTAVYLGGTWLDIK